MMDGRDRFSRLAWGVFILGLLLCGSLIWLWTINDRLAAVDRRGQDDQTRFTALPTADAVAVLEKRLVNLETRMSAAPAFDPASFKTQLKELETRLAAVRTQLGNFSASDLDAINAKINSAQSANLASVRTAIDGIQSDMRGLRARSDQLTQQIASVASPDPSPIRTQVGTLEERITQIEARIGTIASTISKDLQGRLDALAAQVAAARATSATPPRAPSADQSAAIATLKADIAKLPRTSDLTALRSDVQAIKERQPASRLPKAIASVYFGSGSAVVADNERGKIQEVAKQLAANPRALDLVGFSDSRGPSEFNRVLSLRRAAAVRRALIELGVDPAVVSSVVGLGKDSPQAARGSNANEATNRVVVIYER